jgi:two-component system LytT family sensor kinase
MKKIRNHILFWLAYILFKAYLNISSDSIDFVFVTNEVWVRFGQLLLVQLAFLSIKIPFIYSSFYLLNKYLDDNSWFIKSLIAFVFSFCLSVVLMSVINHTLILPIILQYKGELGSVLDPSSLLYHAFSLAFITGIALAIKLLRIQSRKRLHELSLEKERVNTELKYLKAQLNPHFLFNTLNNIYSLARKESAYTPEAILKLSKLMRFMLYEASKSDILLTEEIRIIEDYISLERLRYTDRVSVTFNYEINDPSQRIAPLLLIHFVENAFKHGLSESRSDAFIKIDITLKNGLLEASITNSKADKVTNDESTRSIGLENIKRQLQLIYPAHKLMIRDEATIFKVELSLILRK